MNYPLLAISHLSRETLIIAALFLGLFTVRLLPSLARSVTRSMGQFKRACDRFERRLFRANDEFAEYMDQEVEVEAPVAAVSSHLYWSQRRTNSRLFPQVVTLPFLR